MESTKTKTTSAKRGSEMQALQPRADASCRGIVLATCGPHIGFRGGVLYIYMYISLNPKP